MTHATHFQWTSAWRSHAGLVRAINEDACADHPDVGLWAVADGMGGHSLGDFASRAVVETLNNVPSPCDLSNFVTDVQDRLQTVNRQLRAEAAVRNVQIIGTTVVVLLAHERCCAYLWAGDSRIYLYRDGCTKLLTRDHSALEELKSIGSHISEDAIRHTPRNLVTRAIGAAATLDLDEGTMEVSDGDMFLLCSDGLSNELGEDEMSNVLVHGNCQQASEVLVDMALDRGGRDNISVVVIRADNPCSVDTTVLNPALQA